MGSRPTWRRVFAAYVVLIGTVVAAVALGGNLQVQEQIRVWIVAAGLCMGLVGHLVVERVRGVRLLVGIALALSLGLLLPWWAPLAAPQDGRKVPSLVAVLVALVGAAYGVWIGHEKR